MAGNLKQLINRLLFLLYFSTVSLSHFHTYLPFLGSSKNLDPFPGGPTPRRTVAGSPFYMLNHSFEPNCFFHWRFKDRMLEVMINAGQGVKKGDE
ncbi:plastid transcriptionally active 14, partial [Perilla frutescens var. hirtella]